MAGTFTRTTTDKLSVKGILSENCSTITYVDKNNNEHEVKIVDLLESFKNEFIDLTVSLKNDEDLSVLSEEK